MTPILIGACAETVDDAASVAVATRATKTASGRVIGSLPRSQTGDRERWMKPLPVFGAPPPGLAAAITFDLRQAPQWALCRDRARYVGEAVVMVVAESRAAAADALDRIEVAWEPLPPVVDMTQAAVPGSPLVHPEWGTNVAIACTHSTADPDAGFARAAVVVSETLRIQRYVGMPLEGRGVVAHWDRRDGTLTTWNSTQVPHL